MNNDSTSGEALVKSNSNTGIHKDPVGISTAVCTHMPLAPFSHVGQVTTCKLCGCVLIYGNNPAGTKHRMSKKERRKNKELYKMQTLAQSIKDLQKGAQDGQ